MPAPRHDPAADGPDAAPTGGVEIAPGVHVPAAALRFAASRSGGPGGQNVNKRSTKVELRVRVADIPLSRAASDRLARLAGRRLLIDDLIADAELLIISDEHRTQLRNRAECLDRLRALIIEARRPPKVRRATRPTRGSKERRLKAKRQVGEKKNRRQRPED